MPILQYLLPGEIRYNNIDTPGENLIIFRSVAINEMSLEISKIW